MAEARCVHDMLPGTCGWCSGRDGGETAERKRAERLLARPGVVRAQWSGTCAACGCDYVAGNPIRAHGRGWMAACCMEETT